VIPKTPDWFSDIEKKTNLLELDRWHEQEWEYLLKKLEQPSVIILRGTGRTGKTAQAYYLLEQAKEKGQEVFIMGGNPEPVDWLEQIDMIGDLEEHGREKKTLLIDDIGALGLTARNSQTKEAKQLQEYGTIISHKKVTLLISIQNLSLLDVKGLMTTQDCVILHKLSNRFGITLERTWAKERLERANEFMYHLLQEYYDVPHFNSEDHDAKGLFYDINTKRLAYCPLPSFYGDDISRSYKEEQVA